MTEQPKVHRSIEADVLAASNSASLEADRLDTAEQRMRQALGLRNGVSPSAPRAADRASQSPKLRAPESGTAHRRHRFVQDGEVPVVHVARRVEAGGEPLTPGMNRLQAAEAQIQTERTGRERAERALQSAQAVLHELQTKLGHAELALGEAQAHARGRAAEIEELRAALSDLQSRLAVTEAARRSADETAQEALAALREEIEARKAAETTGPRRIARVARPEKPAPVKATARKPRAPTRETASKAREPQPVKWWLASGRSKRASGKSRS